MSQAPRDPSVFFSSYLPARFADASPELAAVTSVGSITFRVPESGEWTLRLVEGALEVTRGMDDDVMLQVTVPEEDFCLFVVEALERADTTRRAAAGLGALRALAARADVARMVRHVPGSVLFVARDGEQRHRLLVTPGRRVANLASAECTIEVSLSDLLENQGMNPMQLFVAGKLRITGNIQIAMALSGIFG